MRYPYMLLPHPSLLIIEPGHILALPVGYACVVVCTGSAYMHIGQVFELLASENERQKPHVRLLDVSHAAPCARPDRHR